MIFFQTLIYCPVTWHFCSEKNTKNFLKIHERALRFIYEDYENTYENLIKKSKLPSLKIRRLRTIAVETFKIIHKQSPSYLHDIISFKDQKYNIRHQDKNSFTHVFYYHPTIFIIINHRNTFP